MTSARTALPLATPSCCTAGLRTIDRMLRELPGVVDVLLDPALEMAYVEYDPAATGPEALFAVLERAGFVPEDLARTETGPAPRDRLNRSG